MNDAISIIKETDRWLVIDKPAGLIVHPASSSHEIRDTRYESSVVDWLLSKYPAIANLTWPDMNRPGIVHRLDTDTSGVLLLAKDPETLAALQQQFADRTVTKIYCGLVLGNAPATETLTGSISRKSGGVEQQVKRLSFSWEKRPMKAAETELCSLQYLHNQKSPPTPLYERGEDRSLPPFVKEGWGGFSDKATVFTLVELQPKTGRTHQLRVQLLDAGFPMIGDQQYNTKASREVSAELGLARQFLHAIRLEFTDPATNKRVAIESPLAEDLQIVLNKLEGFGPDPSTTR